MRGSGNRCADGPWRGLVMENGGKVITAGQEEEAGSEKRGESVCGRAHDKV